MMSEIINTLHLVLEDVAEVADAIDALSKGEQRLCGDLTCFENIEQEELSLTKVTPLRWPVLEEILICGLEVDSTKHKVWLSTGDDGVDAYIYVQRDGSGVLRVENAEDSTIFVEAHTPEIQAYADFRLPD